MENPQAPPGLLPPKRSYSQLSNGEKWVWHAEVYAFRRIVLGVPVEQRTSPCDEDGQWFDEGLIRAAAARLLDKRERGKRRSQRASDAEQIAEGRAIATRWARKQGFDSMDDYVDAERIDWSEALKRVSVSILSANKVQEPSRGRWRGTAADLGVTAKEFNPSPEEMAASRRHLGIDPPRDEPAHDPRVHTSQHDGASK